MKMNKVGVRGVKKAELDYTQPTMLNLYRKKKKNNLNIVCIKLKKTTIAYILWTILYCLFLCQKICCDSINNFGILVVFNLNC